MNEDPEIRGDFDELHEVFGEQIGQDPWEALVSKSFVPGELVFAIIEHVTIGDSAQIGTPYVFFRTAFDPAREDVRKGYRKIVAHMVRTHNGGPSAHLGWYMRTKSYRIKGTNPPQPMVHIDASPWSPREQQHVDVKVDAYILHREDKVLGDEVIKPYLDTYIRLLKETGWFPQAPHYFIVVKPLSVHDRSSATGKHIPLGNLYLHFGTTRDYGEKHYQDLVRKLVLVWMRNFGYRVVRHQKLTAQNELAELIEHYRPRSDKGTVPQRRPRFDEPVRLAIGKWYAMHGLNIDKAFFTLEDLGINVVRTLPVNERPSKLEATIKGTLLPRYGRWKVDDTIDMNDENGNGLSTFGSMLNVRRLALILLIVVGRSHTEVRDAIRDTHRLPGRETKERSAKLYLLNNFDISTKSKLEAYLTMSLSEKDLVDQLLGLMPERATDIAARSQRKSA